MRDDDGRKLDHRLLERMRVAAVKRIVAGMPVAEVAAGLGLAETTVYGWRRAFDAGGFDALRARPVPGRPPKLTVTQLTRLRVLIVGVDPRQLRFAFALWTREMIAELIAREFEVKMSLSAVGRLLRRMGLSPQRPLWRAYQANPEAVERWKREEFPAIRAEAAKLGAIVLFQDEASVRSDFHSGTTWGEIGHTPVVATTGARHRVNMISSVSAQGKLHFALVEGTVNAWVFIDYCQRLLADHPDRPVFLIVDGHPSHRAKITKEWVASTGGRLKLFYLPGYSPQLNPDEWVWRNVKGHHIGRAGITTADDLKDKARAALERLAALPELIRGFFRDPDLRYITQ